jgi:hypothetical protein
MAFVRGGAITRGTFGTYEIGTFHRKINIRPFASEPARSPGKLIVRGEKERDIDSCARSLEGASRAIFMLYYCTNKGV